MSFAIGRRRDGAVARRRADDLDQRPGDARAHRAVVRVEAAHRDGDALAQSEAPSPIHRVKVTGRRPRRCALSKERSRKLASFGSRRARNAFGGSPPQASEHRLVARRADAADDVFGIVDAGQDRGNEVGQLDPARRRIEHVGRHLQAPPDLRPPPLRRIGAADRREVFGACRAVSGDAAASARGVVLPEPRVRGEVRPTSDRSPAASRAHRPARASIPSSNPAVRAGDHHRPREVVRRNRCQS